MKYTIVHNVPGRIEDYLWIEGGRGYYFVSKEAADRKAHRLRAIYSPGLWFKVVELEFCME